MPRNAADPRQVRIDDALAERRQRRFNEALARTLATADARLVFANLLEEAGLETAGYDAAGSFLYFREGQRAFALRLLTACRLVSPDAADQMAAEARARERSDRREREAAYRELEATRGTAEGDE